MSALPETGAAAPSTTPRAAGMVLPGLGHLLSGERIVGVGMLLLSSELLWATAIGFPQLGALLTSPTSPMFRLHPWIAVLTYVLVAVALWRGAWRYWKVPPAAAAPRTWWSLVRKTFLKNRTGMAGMYLVLALLQAALLAPLLSPFDPIAIDVGPAFADPGFPHLMGTDKFGRDVLSRVLYGARISLSIGFVAVSISATVGTTLGAIAGYMGGRSDRLIMWFTDMLLSLPSLVVLLAIIGIFRLSDEAGLFVIVVILGLTGWMGVARIVRSQVLSLKEQDFIQACRALGLPPWRIVFKHLIPNALAPVIVHASLAIGSTILAEASLSFLGIGVSPPTPTWGNIIREGKDFLRTAWWITLFPGVLIALSVMSFNLLGDGLRDALDPKLRGRE
jgi:peptide/nickel transport system permease protein